MILTGAILMKRNKAHKYDKGFMNLSKTIGNYFFLAHSTGGGW